MLAAVRAQMIRARGLLLYISHPPTRSGKCGKQKVRQRCRQMGGTCNRNGKKSIPCSCFFEGWRPGLLKATGNAAGFFWRASSSFVSWSAPQHMCFNVVFSVVSAPRSWSCQDQSNTRDGHRPACVGGRHSDSMDCDVGSGTPSFGGFGPGWYHAGLSAD